jgi:hypothetical protein
MSGCLHPLPYMASRRVQRQFYILQDVMTITKAHMVHVSRVNLPHKQSKVVTFIFLELFVKRKAPRCIEISKTSKQIKQHHIQGA